MFLSRHIKISQVEHPLAEFSTFFPTIHNSKGQRIGMQKTSPVYHLDNLF